MLNLTDRNNHDQRVHQLACEPGKTPTQSTTNNSQAIKEANKLSLPARIQNDRSIIAIRRNLSNMSLIDRRRYASIWRVLVCALSVIISISIMAVYMLLDIVDVLPGVLTTRQQTTMLTIRKPQTIATIPSLAQALREGNPINHAQAERLISTLIANPSVGNNVSVIITDASGNIVAAHQPRAPRQPASTMKTLTALAAARVLDMGSTLETNVWLRTKQDNTTHAADRVSSQQTRHAKNTLGTATLILQGNGDMLLGSGNNDPTHVNGRAGLQTLVANTARQLRERNIRSITLLIDDSLFGTQRYPQFIRQTDPEGRFYAPISSMALNGARQLDMQDQNMNPDDLDNYPLLDAQPATSVGKLFAKRLREHGYNVTMGTIRDPHDDNSGNISHDSENNRTNSDHIDSFVSLNKSLVRAQDELIASVASAPLGDIMAYMLRRSDNTIAELFGRLVSLRVGKQNTPKGATQAIRSVLEQLHIETHDLHMADCSGLSAGSTLSVRTLVQVQVWNLTAGSAAAAAQGLSLPGFIGTARKRLTDPQAAGLLRVKTGSLTDVTSMSGNVTRQSGGMLTFAVIINEPNDFSGAYAAVNEFMSTLPKL